MLKKHVLIAGLLFFSPLFICRLAFPGVIPTPAEKVVENIRHKGIEKAYFIAYRKTISEMDHSGDKKIDITENKEQILNALNDCRFFSLDLQSSCEAEGKFQIVSGGGEIEIWYSCAGFKIDKPLSIGEFGCPSLMRFANGLLIDENLRVFSQDDFKKAVLEFAAKGNEIALMSLSEWQIKEGIPLIFEKLSSGTKKKFWLAELSRYKDIQNQEWIEKVIPFLKSNDPNSVLRAADILNNWGQRARLDDLAQNKEYVSLTLISWLSQKGDDRTAEKAIPLLMPEKCKINEAYILLKVPSKTAYLKLSDIIEYHGNELYLNLVTDTADSMGMEYDFVRKKFVLKGAATDGGWNIKEVRLQSKIIAQGLREWVERKWPASDLREDFILKEISAREIQMPFLLKEATIPKTKFQVDFQDGFNHERVILYVDDEQVFSKTITSNLVLSLADSCTFQKKSSNVNFTIVLPQKRTKWICSIDFSKGSYIGVAQVKDNIIISQSKEPYLYD